MSHENRFKNDAYDRIWRRYKIKEWTQISTSSIVGSKDYKYEPPSLAIRTAGTPINANHSLDFYIDSSTVPGAEFYLQFSEVEVQSV